MCRWILPPAGLVEVSWAPVWCRKRFCSSWVRSWLCPASSQRDWPTTSVWLSQVTMKLFLKATSSSWLIFCCFFKGLDVVSGSWNYFINALVYSQNFVYIHIHKCLILWKKCLDKRKHWHLLGICVSCGSVFAFSLNAYINLIISSHKSGRDSVYIVEICVPELRMAEILWAGCVSGSFRQSGTKKTQGRFLTQCDELIPHRTMTHMDQ